MFSAFIGENYIVQIHYLQLHYVANWNEIGKGVN
jgi:hypothetical protein